MNDYVINNLLLSIVYVTLKS